MLDDKNFQNICHEIPYLAIDNKLYLPFYPN